MKRYLSQPSRFPVSLICAIVAACLAVGVDIATAQLDTTPSKKPAPSIPKDGDAKPAPSIPKGGTPSIGGDKGSTIAPPRIDIDLLSLLTWNNVISTSDTEDPIWQIRGGGGAYLVQIPMIVEPHESRTIELDKSTVQLQGSKFLAWKIESKNALPDDKRTMRAGQRRNKPQANNTNEGDDRHPDAFPRLTTKVQIAPDGKITWGLDKRFRGKVVEASIKPTAGQYKYKLDLTLIKAKQPAKFSFRKKQPKEKSATYNKAKRAAQIAARAKFTEFMNLMKTTRELPKERTEEMPLRIWSVWEVPTDTEDMTINGPSPLPWKISFAELKALQFAATEIEDKEWKKGESGAPDKNVLPDKRAAAVERLMDMIKTQKHPYALRSSAFVVAMSNLVKFAQPNDPLYQLLETILQGSDGEARGVILKQIATTIPPTTATLALFKKWKGFLKPNERAAVGESVLPTVDKVKTPDALKNTLEAANRELSDPEGLPVSSVLSRILQVSEQQKDDTEEGAAEARARFFVNNMQFRGFPDDRLQEMMIYIINNATKYRLAVFLVDERLLGSQDMKIVKRTLKLISAAEMIEKKEVEGTIPGAPVSTKTKENPLLKEVPDTSRVRLANRLFIFSPKNSILRLLVHDDPEVAKMAWRALKFFDMSPGLDNVKDPIERDRFAVLVKSAERSEKTPTQVVDFLQRQQHPDHAKRVTECLVRIIQRADTAAKVKAARAMLGREGPLEKLMLAMSEDERKAFVDRIYSGNDATVPLVTGLMKEKVEDSPLITWFANEMMSGRLPDPSGWGSAYERSDERRDERLLEHMDSHDPDIQMGALAALVADAGGDDRRALNLMKEWKKLPNLAVDGLWRPWMMARQGIYVERLKKSQGAYQLVLRSNGVNEVQLARVQLRVNDDKTITFGNDVVKLSVPFRKYAIRIGKPADLKNFPNEQVQKLALETIKSPIDMVPVENGQWRAAFELENVGDLELLLKPSKPIAGL